MGVSCSCSALHQVWVSMRATLLRENLSELGKYSWSGVFLKDKEGKIKRIYVSEEARAR